MKLANAPDVLTVEQAADVLSVSRNTLYRAIREGDFEPVVKVGRCLRIPRSGLERLLDPAQTNGATAANGDAGKAGDDSAHHEA